ncbi:DAO-domain-containing protein [Jaminaea rosea]|uniref:L-2-hydroxyglutarate dehydrogenase, mitochondrial n=1 Tax=Jaminaea rosea TaxID=1569628 RepID=A0A316UW50_9BASI|nr:DAO-domain-containing protein [Jaminaea rosea]PWN28551.1 DAO-domain-containing protein [Jaminaea rosea]
MLRSSRAARLALRHDQVRCRCFSTSFATHDAGSPNLPPLRATLPHNRYPPREPSMQVDHLVIGGGVVGLATAAALARRYPDKSTFLVERHRQAGQETSSRNSEVIHAGLYYPKDSLKTQMCLRGREKMYRRCEEWGVPHRQTGKLVVRPKGSKDYFEKMLQHCNSLGALAPPVRLISGDEARQREPDLSQDIEWAVLSERTGIVSSHELMESLEREILDAEAAELVYDTEVVRIDPHLPAMEGVAGPSSKRGSDYSQEGWVVQTVTHSAGQDGGAEGGESDAILARVVINSSGLNGHLALNALLAEERFSSNNSEEAMGMWYAKGNYVSYKGPGTRNVKALIYPIPAMSAKGGLDQGLGTHLTLDLDGNIKFGPDTEWLSPPDAKGGIDFWAKQLAPVTSEDRLKAMHASITSFLPDVKLEGLSPDYAGIRPKLVPPGGGFMDFTLLCHRSRDLKSQKLWSYARLPNEQLHDGAKQYFRGEVNALGGEGGQAGGTMLTLAGIESPGLTSSSAIADTVAEVVSRQVWGHGDAARSTGREGTGMAKEIPKGARNDEVGAAGLDAWA